MISNHFDANRCNEVCNHIFVAVSANHEVIYSEYDLLIVDSAGTPCENHRDEKPEARYQVAFLDVQDLENVRFLVFQKQKAQLEVLLHGVLELRLRFHVWIEILGRKSLEQDVAQYFAVSQTEQFSYEVETLVIVQISVN